MARRVQVDAYLCDSAVEAFNVMVAPHVLMELHVSLAALPNALYAACIPQLGAMTTREVDIKEGRAVAPTGPGLGIAWDHDASAPAGCVGDHP
jgi:L-alanine-DL-glutamate epimerase-like enolase superfamily enzyme